MATIHKFVDDGAEAYLPFLLAREREIRRRKKKERERGQGQAVVTLVEDEPMEGSYTANFDFGDGIEGELRMVGNQSFIRLTKGGSAGSGWVAYPFSISMQYSAANNWPKLSFVSPMPENPGPAPTPPVEQPYPKQPVVEADPFELPPPPACPVEPLPESVFPVHNQGCVSSWVDFTYRDITNRNKAGIDQAIWDAQTSASQQGFPFVSAPAYSRPPNNAYEGEAQIGFAGAGSGNGITYSLVGWTPFNADIGGGWYIIDYHNELYISGFSPGALPMVRYWVAMGAWGAACKSINDANGAASGAYQNAIAAWLVKWNAWNEAVSGTPPDPTVCYQHQDNVLSAMMQTRPTQISALQAEVLLGMRALPVFNGAARPQYVPLERPADTFTQSAGGDSVRVWRSPDFYELEVSSISPGGADPRMCGSTLSTYRFSNVYIDASPSDDRRWGTTKRAFGFSVSGDVNPDFWMGAPPDERNVKLAATYPAWLKSRKTKYSASEEQRNLDYDLTVGRSGRIRLLCFEFRVYDPASEVWVWTPSPRIIETPAAMSCVTGYCLSANRTPPVTPLQPPPSSPVYRVSDMRVLTAFEQAYAPGDDEGTTEWGKPEALSLYNAQFTISLDGLPFDKYELPTGVAVMYGVDPTALPAEPHLRSATTMAHMTSNPPVQPPGSAMDVQSLTEWLVKEGTNALLTAQLAPPTP